MEINVSGRHFEITENVRQKVADSLQAEFGDLTLKIISAHAVLDMEDKKRIKVGIVVNIKGNHVAKAEVEDFDLAKALAEAVGKAGIQARKLIDKRTTSKQGERFVDKEEIPAEDNEA